MRLHKWSTLALLAAILALSSPSLAEPPELQTQGIMIYLADNLDEAQKLGWCIDTLGRGFADELQTHSCKPQGGDVQFGYRRSDQQIYSVAFTGKCMALVDPSNPKVPFGLIDCDPDSAAQRFGFEESSGQIFLAGDRDQCVVAGAESRSAGPFMSRDLTLGECRTTDPSLATWRMQSS